MKDFKDRVTFKKSDITDTEIHNVHFKEDRFLVGDDVKVKVTVEVICSGRENPELIDIGEIGTLIVEDYYEDETDLVVDHIRYIRWEHIAMSTMFGIEHDDQAFIFETDVL